jgi:hypothetical protein
MPKSTGSCPRQSFIRGRKEPVDIYQQVVDILRVTLTQEEWVALGKRLDGDPGTGLLDLVNKHLEVVAPEVFVDGEDKAVA